ncbi:MAG: FecR domain-containing protein [Novosphingobium sp.]
MARQLTAISVLAAAVSLTAPAVAQTVGVATSVVNDVKLSRAADLQPRPLTLRERMALADRIQTGRNSHVQITLLDRSTFSVGANARVTIDRFIYDPATGRGFTSSTAKGAFRFLSGQRSPKREATVNTPIASVGIRGTIAEGVVGEEAVAIARAEKVIDSSSAVDAANATLVVLRGPGANTEAGLEPGFVEVSANGRSVSLDRPALAVFVASGDSGPGQPFVISRKGLRRIQELLMPSLGDWRRSASNSRRFRDRVGGGWNSPPPFHMQP